MRSERSWNGTRDRMEPQMLILGYDLGGEEANGLSSFQITAHGS